MSNRTKTPADLRYKFGEGIPPLDWRTMPDSKEKYQAYLQSREWAEKRNVIHARSGGVCERCELHPVDAVHHLTYARKYNERPEDLAGWCQGCHDFTHGKSNVDPVPRQKVYFAGKIEKQCWRHEIVKGLRGATWGDSIIEKAFETNGKTYDYVGPFFTSCDHGCFHGDRSHGVFGTWDRPGCMSVPGVVIDNHGQLDPQSQVGVAKKCLDSIRDADIVFAWINDPTCYGTLIEIGIAVRDYNPFIMIGFSCYELLREMWFAEALAHRVTIADTASLAWEKLTRA